MKETRLALFLSWPCETLSGVLVAACLASKGTVEADQFSVDGKWVPWYNLHKVAQRTGDDKYMALALRWTNPTTTPCVVRFQARPGSVAGGLYGVRLLRAAPARLP